MSRWDKGVEFDYIYNKMINHLSKTKRKTSICYDFILLVQLVNGLRISESIRSVKEYIRTGKNEFEVLVSKKRKPETRLVIIPIINNINIRSICLDVTDIDDRKLRERVRTYCYYTYKVNTHSLRYAFITHLLKQNVSPTLIAKITRHSKLDFILTYTQQKEAEKVLRGVVNNE